MRSLILLLITSILLLFGCDKERSSDLNKVLNKAVYEKNISLCNSLDKADQRRCYYSYAIEMNDSTICEKVDVVDGLTDSKNSCYLTIAKKTENASLCDKVELTDGKSQTRNLCYYELAIIKKDPLLCEKMTGSYEHYCPPCPPGAVCAPCSSPATKNSCLEQVAN